MRSWGSFLGEDVELWVIIGLELVCISARLDISLAALFTRLCKDPRTAHYIPATVSYNKCEFYQLKNPVSMDSDGWQREDAFLNHVKQVCLEESNKVLVSPTMTNVRKLANNLSYNYVCLVINIPDRKYHLDSE